jgi:hypothetical protein
MKNSKTKQMCIYIIILIMASSFCYCQEELINKEKSEETVRIKRDIEKYKEKYIPLIKNYLITHPNGLSVSELDTLMINVIPEIIINKEALVRLNEMYRPDSVAREIGYEESCDYLYDFFIKPLSGKKTIYSAILKICDDNTIRNVDARIYSKNGFEKYYIYTHTSAINDSNSRIVSVMLEKRYNTLGKEIAREKYPRNYYGFWLTLDSLSLYNYHAIPPGPSTASSHFFKDEFCVLYHDRIYSFNCLVRKYKTKDIDSIFENHADSLCDCDIDAYFRQNIRSEDYWKNKKKGK